MAKVKIPANVMEYFRKVGKEGGKLSASARMKKLSPEKRQEVARKASAAAAIVRSQRAAERRAKAGK